MLVKSQPPNLHVLAQISNRYFIVEFFALLTTCGLRLGCMIMVAGFAKILIASLFVTTTGDVSRLRPPPAPIELIGMQIAAPLLPSQYAAGITFSYVRNPVVWHYPDGSYDPVVSAQLMTDIGMAVGLVPRFDIGAVVPVALVQQGTSTSLSGLPSERLSRAGAGLGDIRVVPRLAVIDIDDVGVGLSLAAEVTLPTGDSQRFRGEGTLTATPRLILSVPVASIGEQEILLSASTGMHFRKATENGKVELGNEIELHSGLSVPLPSEIPLTALAEISALAAAKKPLSSQGLFGAEVIGGIRAYLEPILVTVGAAAGLSDGVGTPDYRIIATLSYCSPAEPEPIGPTEGGGDEYIERCPEIEPGVETFIGLNGCPEPVKPIKAPEAKDLCAEENCPNEDEALTKYIPKVKIDIKSTILFETARSTIKDKSKPILDEVAMQMLAHPEVKKMRIEGHTDSVGPAEDNLYLSQDRADSVRRYLIARGIEKERLFAIGFGETRPIASNSTARGRAKNRRVEFVIVE